VKAVYRALIDVLEFGRGHWDEAPAVDLVEVTVSMAQAETLAKLASGRMTTGELLRLESNRIRDRLARFETGEDKKKNDEAMEILLKVMQKLAPKMTPVEKIRHAQEQVAAENLAQAEQNITRTETGDRGAEAGNENLDLTLKKKAGELARANGAQCNAKK
jgi:regulator of replication initiation timing